MLGSGKSGGGFRFGRGSGGPSRLQRREAGGVLRGSPGGVMRGSPGRVIREAPREKYLVGAEVFRDQESRTYSAKNTVTRAAVTLKRYKLCDTDRKLSVEKEVSICRRIPPYEHILHLKQDVRKKDNCDVVFESHDPAADMSRKIRRGSLRRDTVRDFSRQILLGLAHCHRNMVILRYLNPTKILLLAGGRIKIRNFQDARYLGEIMFDTEEERNLSPINALQKAYLAPELMLRAKHYTDAVDSWACGCIIAEMCTGNRLFPNIRDKHDVDLYLRGITRVLGTITTEKWPTANELPLWPACPPEHPEVDFTWLFPSLGVHGRDLLHGLLAYDPGKRMKVKDALNHPFFEEN